MTLDEAKEEVRLYVTERIRPGPLVLAVLCDRLYTPIAYGDRDSDGWLRDLVGYVRRQVPFGGFGSPELVAKWLSRKEG